LSRIVRRSVEVAASDAADERRQSEPAFESSRIQMSKPPEEGRIWEWRAFGSLPKNLIARVEGLPVRAGLRAFADLDIYLISSRNNQNVKLRRAGANWVLKLKPLLRTTAASIDLYQESFETVYPLPVSIGRIEAAARLLETDLPAAASKQKEAFDFASLVEMFQFATPPVAVVEVPKVRTQFLIDGGWIEMADARFPKLDTQTISIHSTELRNVEETLARTEGVQGLEVMNYVEACRRWG
jgi:hypothetical protein